MKKVLKTMCLITVMTMFATAIAGCGKETDTSANAAPSTEAAKPDETTTTDGNETEPGDVADPVETDPVETEPEETEPSYLENEKEGALTPHMVYSKKDYKKLHYTMKDGKTYDIEGFMEYTNDKYSGWRGYYIPELEAVPFHADFDSGLGTRDDICATDEDLMAIRDAVEKVYMYANTTDDSGWVFKDRALELCVSDARITDITILDPGDKWVPLGVKCIDICYPKNWKGLAALVTVAAYDVTNYPESGFGSGRVGDSGWDAVTVTQYAVQKTGEDGLTVSADGEWKVVGITRDNPINKNYYVCTDEGSSVIMAAEGGRSDRYTVIESGELNDIYVITRMDVYGKHINE